MKRLKIACYILLIALMLLNISNSYISEGRTIPFHATKNKDIVLSVKRLGIPKTHLYGTYLPLSSLVQSNGKKFNKIVVQVKSSKGKIVMSASKTFASTKSFKMDQLNKSYTGSFSTLSEGDYKYELLLRFNGNKKNTLIDTYKFEVKHTDFQKEITRDFEKFANRVLDEYKQHKRPECYTWFGLNFKKYAKYDIKYVVPQNVCYTMTICGRKDMYSPDDLGNILYGYVGSHRFTKLALMTAGDWDASNSGIRKIMGILKGDGDTSRDKEMIKLGINMNKGKCVVYVPDTYEVYEYCDYSDFKSNDSSDGNGNNNSSSNNNGGNDNGIIYSDNLAGYKIGDVVYLSGQVYENANGSGTSRYKGPDHVVIITDIATNTPNQIGIKYPGTDIARYGWTSVNNIRPYEEQDIPTPPIEPIPYNVGDIVYLTGQIYENANGSGVSRYKGPDHVVIITDIAPNTANQIGFKYSGTDIARYGWTNVSNIRPYEEPPVPEPPNPPVVENIPYSVGDVVFISGEVYENADGSGVSRYKGPDHVVIITDIAPNTANQIGFKYPGTDIPRYGWINVNKVRPYEEPVPPIDTGSCIVDTGSYVLVLKESGKALNLYAATAEQSNRNGTNVTVWDITGLSTQGFNIENNSSHYILRAEANGRVLDVQRNDNKNGRPIELGANVQIWENNDPEAQNWLITNIEGEYYTIALASNPNWVIGTNNSYQNGGNICIQEYNGGNNQLWKLIRK